jgi:hypothetical protein
MALSDNQRGVLRGMALGACIAIGLVGYGIASNPLGYPDQLSAAERISVALESGALLALFLAVSVARLARHRFFTPEDIDGGGLNPGSQQALLLQTLLQNTLEQAVLAFLVHLAWSVVMPATSLSVIPLAALAFAIGRLLFFVGYDKGAPSRALGFALTFYPSLAMLLCILVVLLGNALGV